MSSHVHEYYYGTFGIIRGYGPLCRTWEQADQSVFEDGWNQRRRNGGYTDRNAVVVARDTGLCWWWEEEDVNLDRLVPVKTSTGEQASYPIAVIRSCEALWEGPAEIAGFT